MPNPRLTTKTVAAPKVKAALRCRAVVGTTDEY